jgi:hypothetical protein
MPLFCGNYNQGEMGARPGYATLQDVNPGCWPQDVDMDVHFGCSLADEGLSSLAFILGFEMGFERQL